MRVFHLAAGVLVQEERELLAAEVAQGGKLHRRGHI